MDADAKTMAHDVKNELAILLGQLQLLLKKIHEDMSIEAIESSLMGLQTRLNRLATNIGGYFQDDVEMNLASYLSEIAHDLREVLNLNIIIDNFKFDLKVNRGQTYFFFENILKNAHEASARNVKVSGTKNFMVIKDDGKGLTPAILEKINKGEKTSSKGCGRGIGVESMKRYCSKHDLNLKIINATSGGAQIVIAKNET